MRGRDPLEVGRTASSLELLFDLTFVVAVGVAAVQLAELMAAGHTGRAVLAFLLAMFAILVCWINFSWFASAFDTDDWVYRACTMVQMIGVVVLALGLPATFRSIELGGGVDLRVIVAGYVVMRIGLVILWLRVARDSKAYRKVALRNAAWIAAVQVGWVALTLASPPLLGTFAVAIVLGTLELLIPVLTQGRADGTPWHPHHIAERYSLFAIIALGESIVGTVASSRDALGGAEGLNWSSDAVIVVIAGIALTFAMWWTYFLTPFGELLERRPTRGYLFGYGHMPVLIGIAATGAGLHGAGVFLHHASRLGGSGVVLAVAIPLAVYLLAVFGLYSLLFSRMDRFHLVLSSLTLAVLAVAVILSATGVAMPIALLVTTAAAFVPVIGYEAVGYRHLEEQLRRLEEGEED